MNIDEMSLYSEKISKNGESIKETKPLDNKEIKKPSLDKLIIESITCNIGDELKGLVEQFKSAENKTELTAKIKEGLADFVQQGRHLKHYSFEGIVKDIKEYENAKIRTEFLKSIDILNDAEFDQMMKIIKDKEKNFQNQI